MAAAVSGGARPGVAADPQAEPLPRAAVMAVVAFSDIETAADLAADVARLTHPQTEVLGAAREFAKWVVRALEGVPKESLFVPQSEMIADGNGDLGVDAARGDARSVLRLCRGVLSSTASYKEAVLKAINAGGHADVTGAAVGALAGAVYGARSLPVHWLQSLYARERIELERKVDAQIVGTLMSAADVACYVAKDVGRNRIHVYQEGEPPSDTRRCSR